MDDFMKTLLDAGVIVRVGGDLKIKGKSGPTPPELAAQIRERKPELMATFNRGEELLLALSSAGYTVRLEPRASGDGYFLLPLGQSRLPPEELEELFDLYERHHDDALFVVLLGLPVTETGGRDVSRWNRGHAIRPMRLAGGHAGA